MNDRYPFRLTIPQFGFAVFCLVALSVLIFYLGARFGPKLFWGFSLDEIGNRQSLLPSEVTDEELEALLKEEGIAPTTFYDTLEAVTVMKVNLPRHDSFPSPSATTSPADRQPSPQKGEGDLKSPKKFLPAVAALPQKKEEITAVIEKELARYTLKVGSFGSPVEAKTLQSKLARAGYAVSVRAVKIPEKGEWYRVYLGRYSSQSQAESIGKKLQSTYGITPAVVPLDR